jgi:hypothetical protein
MMKLLTIYILCLLMLILIECAAFAQRGPDELLLDQAKSAYAQHDMDTASKTLWNLIRTYPRSATTDDGVALLYSIDISTNKDAEAEKINTTVLKSWPKSELSWQLVETRYRWQVKTDATLAESNLLAAVTTETRLPADAWVRALRLRLEFAEKPGDLLQAEVTRVSAQIAQLDTHNVDTLSKEIAQCYPLLFGAGMIEQAVQIHQSLQTQLTANALWGAAEDDAAFLHSVTPALLNGLCALARHAKIEGESEQLTRVQKELELLAPGSPQALRVKAMGL